MANRISCRMIPAVESWSDSMGTEAIGPVPAAKVQLVIRKSMVSCVGVFDTGSDYCVLEQQLFDRFGEAAWQPVDRIRATMALGVQQVDLFHCELRISGDDPGQTLVFDAVPFVVAQLGRPVFVIGRRGVMEKLRIQMDFPRKTVVLTRPRQVSRGYPNLARELAGFGSIQEAFKTGRIVHGMVMLGLEIERFLDRLLTEDATLRAIPSEMGFSRKTLGQKLSIICDAKGIKDMGPEIHRIVAARNEAVHGMSFKVPDETFIKSLMQAAEALVSRLTRH